MEEKLAFTLFLGHYLPYHGYKSRQISDEELKILFEKWRSNQALHHPEIDFVKELVDKIISLK